MSKDDKPPANPLFSSSNFDFVSSSLFMPVTEQSSSAILTGENDPGEEASFIGQTPHPSQQQQNVATFTMFSQKASDLPGSDPFSSMMSSAATSTASNQFVSISEQEPQLLVPPSSPNQSSQEQTSSYNVVQSSPSGAMDGVQHAPMLQPSGATPSSMYSTPPSNPYSRSALSGPRPMFPSQTHMYQSSTPTAPYTAHPTPPLPTSPPSSTPSSFEKLASQAPPPPTGSGLYQPVMAHWFYRKKLSDDNLLWCPFSYLDSSNLESAHQAGAKDGVNISTDGGRYDVSIFSRERKSAYWDEEPSLVRRATWFCKSDGQNLYSPYEEDIAERLESEYRTVVTDGLWHKRIELNDGEVVVVHSPQLIVHFQPVANKDEFGGVYESQMHSKVVKRGITGSDFEKEIPESESGTPDHVVFLCHGIGPVCDLRFRSVVECVDDFRAIQLGLLQSHFKKGLETNKVHRVEFLPIHWHRALHGDATGVDRNVRQLTLPSISRLRQFTNETLLDILFYSSPVYCQTIADTVGNEINALYKLFLSRNPSFSGAVSLAGHSLGCLILFDLLCHQSVSPPTDFFPMAQPAQTLNTSSNNIPVDVASTDLSVSSDHTSLKPSSSSHSLSDFDETLEDLLHKLNLESFLQKFEAEQMDMDSLIMCSEADLKDIGLPMGPRKKLVGHLKDLQQKEEKRKELEALRNEEIRMQQLPPASSSVPQLSDNAPAIPRLDHLDSIGSFLAAATNVHVDFQQFDAGTGQPLVKYPQLDFHPEMLYSIGSPIGAFLTVRGVSELGEDFALPTCPGFMNIFHPFDPVAYRVEPLVNPDFNNKPVLVPHYKGRKRMHLELKESLGRMGQELKQSIIRSVRLAVGSMQKFAQSHWNQTNTEAEVDQEVKNVTQQLLDEQSKSGDAEETASVISDGPHADLGKLNGGRRIDYVLQERPLESFNDYLFAFQSHLCYWNNEDTVLLMMKEIYGAVGVMSDRQLEKQEASLPPPPQQQPPYTANHPPPMSTISLS